MKKNVALLLLPFLIFLLPFCGGKKKETKVIVLGFDGADWDFIDPLIAEGHLPNFKLLKEKGAWARLKSMKPTLSAVIWTTIATGKRMEKHGIVDWLYLQKKGIKVPYNSSERREPAIWEILSEAGKSSAVINWYVSYPPDHINGIVISDAARGIIFMKNKTFALRDSVYPPKFFDIVRESVEWNYWKVLKETRIPDYLKMARDMGKDPSNHPVIKDFKPFLLMEKLVYNMGEKVWNRGKFDFFALYFRWPDVVTHFIGMFLPPELATRGLKEMKEKHRLEPKLRKELDEKTAELLLPVYSWLDLILGEYIKRMDEDTYLIVLSDHGFDFGPQGYNHELPDWMAPPLGILAVLGPEVKKGYQIKNASVFDIAPTILYLYNLPIGKGMDGKPLLDAFRFSRKIKYRKYFRKKFVKKHLKELDRKTLKELHSLGYI